METQGDPDAASTLATPGSADETAGATEKPHFLLDQAPEGVTVAIAASALRERIYGSIACLSTLLVITGYQPVVDPWEELVNVLVTTGGLWAASVLAEYVGHLGAHQATPSLKEIRHMLWVSGQIMAASAIPLILLLLSVFDVISLHSAVWAGVWVLIVEMGGFAYLTVRSTSLRWWGRAGLISSLLLLGLLVVFVKTLAH